MRVLNKLHQTERSRLISVAISLYNPGLMNFDWEFKPSDSV